MSSASPEITRIEPLRPRGLRVRIHLDRGEPLEISLEALERSRLGVGDALLSDRRRHLLDADADIRVREAALHLLSFRARSCQELRNKLRQKGFRPARIDTCLDQLQRRGLLDDAAVAAAFVRDRLRFRPRGKAKLSSELRAKGIRAEIVDQTIERVFEDEDASDARLAQEVTEGWISRQGAVVQAALASGAPTPEREKARRRLYGYLVRRGFGGSALAEAMERVEELARRRSPPPPRP